MSQLTAPIDAGTASHEATGLMRAGVYRGKGQVVVESVPIPEIGEGEVLFRVAACGICGTDITGDQAGVCKSATDTGARGWQASVVKVWPRRDEV